jgi:CheY-like chemotaxis protein
MSANLRILAVDDNKLNLMILEEIFEDKYDIRSVLSGEEALGIVREFMPHIILLDIMMPGIDGYEVCKKIKTDDTLKQITIIFVSSRAMKEEIDKGYKVGADGFITKPYEEREMLEKIDEIAKDITP